MIVRVRVWYGESVRMRNWSFLVSFYAPNPLNIPLEKLEGGCNSFIVLIDTVVFVKFAQILISNDRIT